MRRHRRSYLSGLFFNTGNYDLRTVDDTFGFTRQFADAISQEMMDDERLDRKHKQEDAMKKQDALDAEKPLPENPEA